MKQRLAAKIMIGFMFLVSGCATVATVRDAKGTGTAQVFNASYEKVFNAAVNTFRDRAIEIVERNQTTGTIIGKKGMGMATYGERIAVFVTRLEENETRVEVVSKKVLATTIFAKDWTETLFSDIQQNLKESK